MKLNVKNKFSLGGSSTVTDERGNIALKVKGKVFSPTHKKKICGADGNLVYKVRNKFWRLFWHKAFIYDANGEKLVTLRRKFSFNNNFAIDGSTADYRIDGDIIGRNYSVYRNGVLIGSVVSRFVVMLDSFDIDVVKEEDAPLLVAFVIAIDNIRDRKSRG